MDGYALIKNYLRSAFIGDPLVDPLVGYWDPSTKPANTKVKTERIEHWIKLGAKPSETVRSILKKSGMKLK